ncbi:hypothetical protein AYL99_08973 [Fonsecaea erecta]|uniref:Uncharacterized protein n=1 Tax=Fonsecaea erecta TaxID=1367422 RepID=A0A178ZBK6_9EURO|nr:hypothetical protein AYL99_08973 [Fonsecaea erecta]OAP56861.1 hypothetical protein AYL99_08973 [Fonsecaea erecta]
MGISDGLVVFLCILIAGIVVAGAAALHRVVATREFTEALPQPTNEQQSYMRMLRSRKWPGLRVEERQAPSTVTSSYTSDKHMEPGHTHTNDDDASSYATSRPLLKAWSA